MPATSKAQQRFMGIVHGLQKGTTKPSDVSGAAKKAAKSMKKKSAKDFAKTKHKGLPNKVKEALLSENPAASAAAAMVMMQMQNPDTGKKVKAITPLRNKDHKLHSKAKGIFKRLKDKFSKKKPQGTVHNYLRGEEVEEGFGGDLKGSDKTKFEKARKENAEQLGYELTGVTDIKEGKFSSVPTKKLVKTYKQMADEKLSGSSVLTFRLIAKELIKRKAKLETVEEERDYKAEYKKYGSSTKAKKYRAELNQYNRKKGTYGNGDGKDASHKGGKIVGFEKESTNRGRAEKSRLKKESVNEKKNPKREKVKKDFKTSLKFAKGVIRKIDTFMKSDDWGVVDGFVTNKRTGLASIVKDMEKSMNQIIKLPVDESVNEAVLTISYQPIFDADKKDKLEKIAKKSGLAIRSRGKQGFTVDGKRANVEKFIKATRGMIEVKESVSEDTKDIAKAKQISRQIEKMESKYRKAMYDLSDRLQADPKNHKLQDELIKSYTKHVTTFMKDMIKITKRVK